MGQYWILVNLDKEEFVDPHKLGCGLKLGEQLGGYPGTGAAMIVLCANMVETRGGGDLDLDENWHGPERTDMSGSGPMPEDYPNIARRTIGRWAGDRIALIGDYAEDSDLPNSPIPPKEVYARCEEDSNNPFTDVSEDVAAVIEHELNGKFEGDRWKTWKTADCST